LFSVTQGGLHHPTDDYKDYLKLAHQWYVVKLIDRIASPQPGDAS
jgi:hypothetical protein